jgi:hypothetical protein
VANITPLFDSWRKFNTNRGTELRNTALSDLKQSLIAYGVTTRSLSGRTLYVFDSRAITAKRPKQRSTESFVPAISHPIQLDLTRGTQEERPSERVIQMLSVLPLSMDKPWDWDWADWEQLQPAQGTTMTALLARMTGHKRSREDDDDELM